METTAKIKTIHDYPRIQSKMANTASRDVSYYWLPHETLELAVILWEAKLYTLLLLRKNSYLSAKRVSNQKK